MLKYSKHIHNICILKYTYISMHGYVPHPHPTQTIISSCQFQELSTFALHDCSSLNSCLLYQLLFFAFLLSSLSPLSVALGVVERSLLCGEMGGCSNQGRQPEDNPSLKLPKETAVVPPSAWVGLTKLLSAKMYSTPVCFLFNCFFQQSFSSVFAL